MKYSGTLLFIFLFINAILGQAIAQVRSEAEIRKSITIATSENQKFESKIELGNYLVNNDLIQAKSIIDELKQSTSRNKGDNSIKLVLLELRYFYILRDFESFEACFQKVNLSSVNNENLKIEFLIFSGISKQFRQNYTEAMVTHKEALMLTQKSRNNSLTAEVLRQIGLNYTNLDNRDSALYYSNRSIAFARKTSSNSGILAECFNSQAIIYNYFNQIEIGIAKNILALEIAENAQDKEKLSRINREIGISQLEIKNWNDAESYFKKSLDYARKLYDNSQVAQSLIHLAAVEQGRKNYSQAKKYAFEAETYVNKTNHTEAKGDIDNFIGVLYNDLGDFKQAAIRLNKALVNYESNGNRIKIANVYHQVGKVLMQQGKYLEAENFLNRSINMRKEIRKIGYIHESYKVLSDLNLKQNNISGAYKFLNLYVQYLDSNNMLQSARSIAELNETFKTQDQLRTINLQSDSIKRAKEKQELTNSKLENTQLRNTYQLIFIVFILLIVVASGMILKNYWNRLKLQQLQKETEMSQTLLRSQMNPHFIFNAMTVIQSYIYENDPAKSSKFLVNFSRLMRLILENSSKEFISLETEVEILQKYLTTQKLRFEDRFNFEITIDKNLSESETLIPPMITQPFIENSIEHGQLHTIENGFINVHFSRLDSMLKIQISDNGIGRKKASQNKKSKEHHSMAMNITEERIDILNKKYQSKGKLEISDFDKINETGTFVHIEIPLKFKNQITEK